MRLKGKKKRVKWFVLINKHIMSAFLTSLYALAHPCNTPTGRLRLSCHLIIARQLKLHRTTTSRTFGNQSGRSSDLVALYIPMIRAFLVGVGCAMAVVEILGLSPWEAKVRFPFPFRFVS
jgi:hypothetical protein